MVKSLPTLLSGFFAVFVLTCSVVPVNAENGPIGVLLSREISPYIAMVEGLERALLNQSVQRFFLDKEGRPYSLIGPGTELNPQDYTAMIAVGPKALRYLNPRVNGVPLLFGMVLNPQDILATTDDQVCGVSLNIPVESQLSSLFKYLPEMKRLGVLFDPANNQSWFAHAASVAEARGVQLIPLHVERADDRLSIVGNFSSLDALLLIPDKTIISKTIIQHVIKQAFLKYVPVVGYNRFFLDSGAALNFIINYELIGQQVAEQLETSLRTGSCNRIMVPAFDMEVNPDVWKALGLPEKQEMP